jgi:phage/plasmid-associated DNA primase
MKLRKLIIGSKGRLNEAQIANVLYSMFGNVFVCDIHDQAKAGDRTWFEFVFPDSDVGKVRGYVYKWRCERQHPDTLDKYISKKMPEFLQQILDWVEEKIVKNTDDESYQAYYELIKKNVGSTIHNLGNHGKIESVLKRCGIEFRTRGFFRMLDKDPAHLGVGNGVLKLYPAPLELYTRYHEIPISRSTFVDFEFYDPENPFIKELEPEIRRLFVGDDDAHEYIMCYLASSLDGRKRKPLFFIWLGEGRNGKSFLLEMHINSMGAVMNDGYSAKLNIDFFTGDRKNGGGPDTEKMMLKFARFAYTSESKPGDVLRMEKIKEITSETVSGNDKYLTQEMFEANCNFTLGTNNDPRITGRDYGTWRRILTYRFKMTFLDAKDVDPNNKYHYKDDKKYVEVYPKSHPYQKAYISILSKYYVKLRDVYKGDLDNIPKPTIDRETQKYHDEQDTVSRFITEQLVLVGEYYSDNKKTKVSDISVTEIVAAYENWYAIKIDKKLAIDKQDAAKAIREDGRLRKHIVEKHGSVLFLSKHRLLAIGEDYDNNIDTIPGESKRGRADNVAPETLLGFTEDDFEL